MGGQDVKSMGLSDKELVRQGVHLSAGIVLMVAYAAGLAPWWVFGLILLAGYGLLLLHTLFELPLIPQALELLDRKDAHLPGWGAFTLVKGFLVASFLFNKEAALGAMAVLVIGDAVATLIGHYLGTHRLPWAKRKTFEGTFAGIVASTITLLFILPWYAAIAGSVCGMMVESLEKEHPLLNDNILVPIATGTVLLIILAF